MQGHILHPAKLPEPSVQLRMPKRVWIISIWFEGWKKRGPQGSGAENSSENIAVNIGWVHLDWHIVCTIGKRDRACMYWNAPFFHLRSIFFLRFRWWFKYVFMFNHICGNDPIWLTHIFQKGWFNHRSKWSYSTLGKLNGRNLKISQWKKENHLPHLHIFGEPRDQSHYPLLSAGTFGSIMTSGFGPMVVQYISDGFWNHQLGESLFRSFLS